MSAKNPRAEALFDDIEHYIAESRRLIEQGALAELAGLDAQVKRLCDEVTKLKPENRPDYAARMEKLYEALQGLEGVMLNAREALAGDMRTLSDHNKANVAYRTAHGDDPKPPEEE